MTGFAFGPEVEGELVEIEGALFPSLPRTMSGPLTPEQSERLKTILVSVGLSLSQSDQIVRRFNESSPLPDERRNP